MARPKGVKNGRDKGRKPGVAEKLRKEAEQIIKWTGETPAEFAQRVMQDDNRTVDERLKAAQMGFPYVHRKQPEAREHTGSLEFTKRVILEDDASNPV